MVFLYSHWLTLPISTRIAIAQGFNIPKIRSTHVSGNEIVDDGYNIKDIEKTLTLVALQSYLGSEESDFPTLWKLLVDKVEGRIKPITATIEPVMVEFKPEHIPVSKPTIKLAKKGKPKKL